MKSIIIGTLAFALSTTAAFAWGDDGHKVVALIAEHYLTPVAKRQVDALLAADTDNLTAHDIASEATGPTGFAMPTVKLPHGTSPTSRSRIPT